MTRIVAGTPPLSEVKSLFGGDLAASSHHKVFHVGSHIVETDLCVKGATKQVGPAKGN